jgi:hypothetical protein
MGPGTPFLQTTEHNFFGLSGFWLRKNRRRIEDEQEIEE